MHTVVVTSPSYLPFCLFFFLPLFPPFFFSKRFLAFYIEKNYNMKKCNCNTKCNWWPNNKILALISWLSFRWMEWKILTSLKENSFFNLHNIFQSFTTSPDFPFSFWLFPQIPNCSRMFQGLLKMFTFFPSHHMSIANTNCL